MHLRSVICYKSLHSRLNSATISPSAACQLHIRGFPGGTRHIGQLVTPWRTSNTECLCWYLLYKTISFHRGVGKLHHSVAIAAPRISSHPDFPQLTVGCRLPSRSLSSHHQSWVHSPLMYHPMLRPLLSLLGCTSGLGELTFLSSRGLLLTAV